MKTHTCQSVLNTKFARVFGMPNSLLGVIYYLLRSFDSDPAVREPALRSGAVQHSRVCRMVYGSAGNLSHLLAFLHNQDSLFLVPGGPRHQLRARRALHDGLTTLRVFAPSQPSVCEDEVHRTIGVASTPIGLSSNSQSGQHLSDTLTARISCDLQ
jgi:hypothetical protein